MRILIKSATKAETVLCDGPGRGPDKMWGPLNNSGAIDDTVLIDPQQGMRAPSIRMVNRLNRSINMTLVVSRQCASIPAAFAWQMDFHATCIRAGDIFFTEADTSGNTVTWKLTTAVLNIATTPMGATRVVTFTIQGGELIRV